MIYARRVLALGIALIGLLPVIVNAQDYSQVPPPAVPLSPAPPGQAQAPQAAPPPGQQPPQAFTQQQVDQLLAPVALYPDQLIAQILMGATYPLEIVEAQRWLQTGQNAQLKGDQLAAALEQQEWDPSVKSLVAFPQVLNMMNNNLQWTEQLGDAFLSNQAGVMDTVQQLRQRAQTAGHLQSTPQQTVSAQDGEIMIQPPTQQVVYVPYYDPTVVYGAWPYPGYPPYYFPPPPGYVYYPGAFIGFGVGIGIVDLLWGWDRWDWRAHHIIIDDRRWAALDHFHGAPRSNIWAHDVDHRHGVPYRSAAARAQFGGAAEQARRNFRGFQPAGGVNAATTARASNFAAERNNAASPAATHTNTNFQRPQTQNAPVRNTPQNFSRNNQETVPRTQVQSRGQQQSFHQQRSAPMFESFSRGNEVHAQSMRGASSRAAMPASAPGGRASVPSGGGNRGGGDHAGGAGGGGHDNGRNH